MFDINYIRNNPKSFDEGLARRGVEAASARILDIDSRRRALQTEIQEAQAERNAASKKIGEAKQAGIDSSDSIARVQALKEQIGDKEEEERALADALERMLSELPNLPLVDVPDGEDETGNRLVREVGEIRDFDFDAKEHFEIGDNLGLMDFNAANRLSGSRFVVLRGALARLERALGQFMLDLQTTENGYSETATPYLVRADALYGTGQLPKFSEDLYHTDGDHWLIPTAEVSLTNLEREQILTEDDLPLRVAALTPCFRSEAGAAGKDTRGMIRQHQFSKVELVSVTRPEDSLDELERMTGCAEEVLKRLEIPYRVMELCTGDLGFAARKTYDIEVWLPGQRRYREISSCSDCGDFQARRMKMRCRSKNEKKTRYPHTLNGSGLAVGRSLIAVMENYQQNDGSVLVPDALRPYMGEIERIGA